MSEQKNLLIHLGEALERHRTERRMATSEPAWPKRHSWLYWLGRQMIPNIGTLLLVAAMLLTVPSLAAPRSAPEATSTSTISYQGRLADNTGNPLTGYYNLEFRIYNVPTAGVPLWEEFWTGGNSVQVSDGLFNVMLGSINNALASAIEGYDELYLGITVGTDSEMAPRVQLGSVPYAMYAAQANIPDGNITTEKLADGAVTSAKMDAVDAYSYVAAQESITSTDWLSLPTPDSVTIALAKTQWVNVYYGATCGATTGHPAYVGLSIDGGPVDGSTLIEMWNGTSWWISGFHRVQLSAGSHTIELKYKTNSGGTATYWRRKLLAFSISQ